MLIYPEFPPNRKQDPKRHAEWLVYQAFEDSDRDGHALYELKVNRRAPEVDFFALIQDKAVVCMQVKGGQYRVIDGDWHLETDDGLEYTPCPMKLTWDSAMAVRDFLKEKLGTENLHGRRPAAAGHGTGPRHRDDCRERQNCDHVWIRRHRRTGR